MHHHTVFPDFSAFQITLPVPKGSLRAGQAEPLASDDWAPFWPDCVRAATGFPASSGSAPTAGGS